MASPNVVVSALSQLFTLPDSFAAIAGGSIYIGRIDTDPTVVANQIQVYVQNDDGSTIAVSQPISIGIGGYPEYNGAVARFVTVEGQSMAVLDTNGVQQFYFPNIVKYDPDQLAVSLSESTGASKIGMSPQGTLFDAVYWLTPEMFGAIGDGVTDDTAALQSAINASQYKSLIFRNGKTYLSGLLTIPHPMTLQGLGRRQNGNIKPKPNLVGNFINVTTYQTVTFVDLTIDARGIPQFFEDGRRLNGIYFADNTSGVYQPAMKMTNCNVSGFSGCNIYGGMLRSLGYMENVQSESAGKNCINILGVDWRLSNCQIGRSLEGHGIYITQPSANLNMVDSYENALCGLFYLQPSGKSNIAIAECVFNGNGQHGIGLTGPYSQPSGATISNCRFFNNSKSMSGNYHNIDLSYMRGVALNGNNHDAYQATEGSTSARCGFCINLRNNSTLTANTDTYDPWWSFIHGFINGLTESLLTSQENIFGSRLDLVKLSASDTRLFFQGRLINEGYNRVEIGAGNIKLGNGGTTPTHGITTLAAYSGVTMGIRSLGVKGVFNSSVLRIGTFRLWSDGAGKLRVKADSDPATPTDGAILFE